MSLEPHSGQRRPGCWGRKDEEYIADFCLLAKRTLTEEEHRLFRFHYLLGADWKLCSKRLGLERGGFFHAAYRIEQKLGRVFREVEPYPLYPLDEYYNGPARTNRAIPFIPIPRLLPPLHLRFPMPLAA